MQFVLVPRANRLTQRHHAGRGRVLRLVLMNGFDGRLLDVVGSGEIRFAGTKVGDVHTFGLELVGSCNNRRCLRDLDAVDSVRESQFWLLRLIKQLTVNSLQSRAQGANAELACSGAPAFCRNLDCLAMYMAQPCTL